MSLVADKWAVVSRRDCKFCIDVKRLLSDFNIEYEPFDIRDAPDLGDFLSCAGFTTVPQVFHNGKVVGGYTDTQRYLRLIGVDRDESL